MSRERYDDATFRQLLRDIEQKLGYLKANEEIWNWADAAVKEFRGAGNVAEHEVPYPVYTTGALFRLHLEPADEAIHHARVAYLNGIRWAQGIADYIQAACDWFTSVDTDALAGAARSLDGIAADLAAKSLHGGFKAARETAADHFSGATATAFRNFASVVNDQVKTYAAYLATAAAASAAASVLVAQAQDNLMAAARTTLANLDEALDAWKKTEPLIPGVLSGVSYELVDQEYVDTASTVLLFAGLIPGPQQGVVGAVGTTVDILAVFNSSTAESFGVENSATAAQVYEGLGELVLDKTSNRLQNALTDLHVQHVQGARQGLDDLVEGRRWHVEDLRGLGDIEDVRDGDWTYTG